MPSMLEPAADVLLAPGSDAKPLVHSGSDRAGGGRAAGPSSGGCAGTANTSNETYDETGLPGSVRIGVASSPTKPNPCGLPGCIATSPNDTVPSSESTSLTTS